MLVKARAGATESLREGKGHGQPGPQRRRPSRQTLAAASAASTRGTTRKRPWRRPLCMGLDGPWGVSEGRSHMEERWVVMCGTSWPQTDKEPKCRFDKVHNAERRYLVTLTDAFHLQWLFMEDMSRDNYFFGRSATSFAALRTPSSVLHVPAYGWRAYGACVRLGDS